jgi:selenide,water dikinase
MGDEIDPALQAVLYDPQTSGGLLIAANEDYADAVEAALRQAGISAPRVGNVQVSTREIRVAVRP